LGVAPGDKIAVALVGADLEKPMGLSVAEDQAPGDRQGLPVRHAAAFQRLLPL